jgi:Cu+-exporting ATPase
MDASVAAPSARPGSLDRVDLALEGMTCAACAARIEKVLNRIPGAQATVNFATESAAVHYDRARADAAELIAAVQKAGYRARVRRGGEAERRVRETEREAHRDTLRREFLIAVVLTLPLVAQMVPMATSGTHQDLLPRALQLALATPVQWWIGRRFYVGAWRALRGGGANMDVLIALGTSIAWGWSAVVTLAGLSGEHVYFEASAAVITLVLLGKLLEARAKAGTSAALTGLLQLQPRSAFVERDGQLVEVPLAALRPDDPLVVRAGDAVPVDGVVTDGVAMVDESMLTGESRAVTKRAGSPVYAGTLNQDGMLRCKATGVGDATLLAGIVRQVRDAQGSKAPIQRLADRVAGVFVPIVVGIAVVAFAATWWLAADGVQALVNAVAVLVIACPCALGLATPAAIIVGTGRGAQMGIVIRDAAALELAGRLQTLLADKTGTLTEGKPAVVDVIAFGAHSPADVLSLAAALEQGSTHPLADAIVAHARAAGAARVSVAAHAVVAGKGVRGRLDGRAVLLGSADFLAEAGVAVDDLAKLCASAGTSVVAIASGTELVGAMVLADRLRESTPAAIARLKAIGVRVVMITGDNATTAEAVARAAGIDEVRAQVLPADKAAAVAAFKAQGRVTGMVGDGINDAPALAAADVSFAIGAGAAVAIEAADITVIRNDLDAVVDAILLSRATLAKIRQNLFFAFGYNVLGIPLAAVGMLDPVIAGAAMAASSVSVVGNALLLKRWHPLRGRQPSGAESVMNEGAEAWKRSP